MFIWINIVVVVVFFFNKNLVNLWSHATELIDAVTWQESRTRRVQALLSHVSLHSGCDLLSIPFNLIGPSSKFQCWTPPLSRKNSQLWGPAWRWITSGASTDQKRYRREVRIGVTPFYYRSMSVCQFGITWGCNKGLWTPARLRYCHGIGLIPNITCLACFLYFRN